MGKSENRLNYKVLLSKNSLSEGSESRLSYKCEVWEDGVLLSGLNTLSVSIYPPNSITVALSKCSVERESVVKDIETQEIYTLTPELVDLELELQGTKFDFLFKGGKLLIKGSKLDFDLDSNIEIYWDSATDTFCYNTTGIL